jgi:hypothetical protein
MPFFRMTGAEPGSDRYFTSAPTRGLPAPARENALSLDLAIVVRRRERG